MSDEPVRIGGGVSIQLIDWTGRKNRYAKSGRRGGSIKTTRRVRVRCAMCGGTGETMWGGEVNPVRIRSCGWCRGMGWTNPVAAGTELLEEARDP